LVRLACFAGSVINVTFVRGLSPPPRHLQEAGRLGRAIDHCIRRA
jgi:hypothetical protein